MLLQLLTIKTSTTTKNQAKIKIRRRDVVNNAATSLAHPLPWVLEWPSEAQRDEANLTSWREKSIMWAPFQRRPAVYATKSSFLDEETCNLPSLVDIARQADEIGERWFSNNLAHAIRALKINTSTLNWLRNKLIANAIHKVKFETYRIGTDR